jgi:aminoglycoside phosphotransferase (APT) family kinase protein
MASEDSRPDTPWVRFEPPLLPGPGLLGRLLEAARPGARATAIDFLDRGVVNSNYRVSLSDARGEPAAPLLLRLSRSVAGAEREATLARQLALRLPGLVAAPLALSREAEPEPHAARLVEWIDGVPLDEAAPGGDTEALLPAACDLGEALRRLHEERPAAYGRLAADGGVVLPPEGAPPTFAAEIGRRIHLRLENPAHGLAEEVREQLEDLLERLAETAAEGETGAPSLVHGDLSPGNILLRREGDAWRLAGLIDWEMARAAHPAVDEASLVFEAGTRWPRFTAEVFRTASGGRPDADVGTGAPFDLALLLVLLDARMVALVRRSEPLLASVDARLQALADRHRVPRI